MLRLVIWGSGELGSRVGKLWVKLVGSVMGFTQTTGRHTTLQEMGIEPQLGNPGKILDCNDILLLALPGHVAQLKAVQTLVEHKVPPPARAVLISSTAYYGMSGGIINEESPPGQSNRSLKVAALEQVFQSWAGANGLIIRLGGLYRPGRGPLPVLARRGVPRLRPPDKTLTLIHYDDAAATIFAALQHPAPEKIYLAVTPPCPSRQEFYRLACDLLKLPEPTFAEPLGHPRAEYDTFRLRRDLLPEPLYPDWQAALIVP